MGSESWKGDHPIRGAPPSDADDHAPQLRPIRKMTARRGRGGGEGGRATGASRSAVGICPPVPGPGRAPSTGRSRSHLGGPGSVRRGTGLGTPAALEGRLARRLRAAPSPPCRPAGPRGHPTRSRSKKFVGSRRGGAARGETLSPGPGVGGASPSAATPTCGPETAAASRASRAAAALSFHFAATLHL